jgi:hypothetical protein
MFVFIPLSILTILAMVAHSGTMPRPKCVDHNFEQEFSVCAPPTQALLRATTVRLPRRMRAYAGRRSRASPPSFAPPYNFAEAAPTNPHARRMQAIQSGGLAALCTQKTVTSYEECLGCEFGANIVSQDNAQLTLDGK